MDGHSLTRRQWLRSVAVTGTALGLPACGRPQQSALALPTLVVDAPDFVPLTAELIRAWDPRKSGALLQFGLRRGASDATADILLLLPDQIADSRRLLPLRSYLADANFDLSTLAPGVTATWADRTGDVLALPIHIAEYQCYVNHSRLQALGFKEPKAGAWAFTDMRVALDRAVVADPQGQAPLVVGAWDDPNFVGAAIVGYGGTLRDGQGRLDLTLATAALQPFIDFVEHVRWLPASLSQTSGTFVLHGFTGPLADALFAFVQPWNFLINSATQDAVRSMAPVPFPAFPARRVIPGFAAAGLAVSQASLHPDLAVRFLLWLLKPDQQRLLAAHGWPPVILDPATVAFWQREMDRTPDLPRFEADAYLTFEGLAESTRGPSIGVAQLDRVIEGACVRMYRGEDVAAQLAAVQRAIDATPPG